MNAVAASRMRLRGPNNSKENTMTNDNTTGTPPMHPLFAMNAEFLISPTADAFDLQTDISALLEPIRATLTSVAGELSEAGHPPNITEAARMLYGTVYLLDMLDGMNSAAMSLNASAGRSNTRASE
jgi:hypothetical protein